MRKLLLASVAGAAVVGLALPARATLQIIAFGQQSGSNTVTGTPNAGDTATTISTTNTAVGITQIFGGVPTSADFDLTANSIDSVTAVGGALLQHYDGSFCVTSGAGCGGVDFLSGTFTDAAFGLNGGAQLSVNVASPPDTLHLTSSVIPAGDLVPPSSFTLSFSNVSPALHEVGTTLGLFGASFSGVASSAVQVVPEPGSVAVLLAGIVGLGLVRRLKAR